MNMKRTVIPRLHDTEMNFRTERKISLRHKNRGELAPVWLAPEWHFVLVSCKRIQSHKREAEWTRAGMKVAPVSCNQALTPKKSAKAASSDACRLCGVKKKKLKFQSFISATEQVYFDLKGLQLKKFAQQTFWKYILVYMLNWIHKLENLPVNAYT